MMLWRWALIPLPTGSGYVCSEAYLLDFLIVMRAYCVLLYLNNATSSIEHFAVPCPLSEIPLSVVYVRTSFVFDRTRTSVAVLLAGWCALALLFSKGEATAF